MGHSEKGLQIDETLKKVFRPMGHSEKGLQMNQTLWKGSLDGSDTLKKDFRLTRQVKAELKLGRRLACKNVEKVPIFPSASFVLVVLSIFVQRKYFWLVLYQGWTEKRLAWDTFGTFATSSALVHVTWCRRLGGQKCQNSQPCCCFFKDFTHQLVTNWTRNQVFFKVNFCLFIPLLQI